MTVFVNLKDIIGLAIISLLVCYLGVIYLHEKFKGKK